jgi:hypothetical protein
MLRGAPDLGHPARALTSGGAWGGEEIVMARRAGEEGSPAAMWVPPREWVAGGVGDREEAGEGGGGGERKGRFWCRGKFQGLMRSKIGGLNGRRR